MAARHGVGNPNICMKPERTLVSGLAELKVCPQGWRQNFEMFSEKRGSKDEESE